jgi:hypothetical protein
MLNAIDWFDPGLGGGGGGPLLTLVVGLGVGPPPVDDDGDDDEPEDAGCVASFGAPTRLRVLAAESSMIICWRSFSSRTAE